MIKYTELQHKDYSNIEKALEKIIQINNEINHGKALHDKMSKLKTLQHEISIPDSVRSLEVKFKEKSKKFLLRK